VATRGVHRQCQSPPHVKKPLGLARDDGRRAPAVPVAATCHRAVRTRPRRRETCIGSASRRHTSRSRSNSLATTGGAHRRHTSRSRSDTPTTTGGAHHRHTPRSRSDSLATMGGVHRQRRSPPHVTEPFRLACDDGRCALAVHAAPHIRTQAVSLLIWRI
jgi:hypothetical protein